MCGFYGCGQTPSFFFHLAAYVPKHSAHDLHADAFMHFLGFGFFVAKLVSAFNKLGFVVL
jgi:hypothetical protein